jgi:hypothetical protein
LISEPIGRINHDELSFFGIGQGVLDRSDLKVLLIIEGYLKENLDISEHMPWDLANELSLSHIHTKEVCFNSARGELEAANDW